MRDKFKVRFYVHAHPSQSVILKNFTAGTKLTKHILLKEIFTHFIVKNCFNMWYLQDYEVDATKYTIQGQWLYTGRGSGLVELGLGSF